MKPSRPLFLVIACLMAGHVAALADVVPPGLTIRDGRFLKDGKPFHGVGINYFNCLLRITGLSNSGPALENRDYVEGFRVLREHGIPFVRFAAGGFWPNDWDLYLKDREAYFRSFDGLVAEAERAGIGLIPSLFWNYSTVPDLVGDSIDQWGNPESATQAFMRRYVAEVVGRYKDSPAVWAWEFGNEYINEADLPQPEMGRGWEAPGFGTPVRRTERDKMLRPNIHAAYRAFGEAVRKIDRTRPLFTGDTMPRPAAWHNWRHKSWDSDNTEQWAEVFLADNPLDTLSAHFYHFGKDDKARCGLMELDAARQMAFMMDISRKAEKPLFIGEFGPSPQRKDEAEERRQFMEMLGMIVANRVPLTALWNYDFEQEGQKWFNITPQNHRAWMLAELREANRKLQAPENP
jgi:hypothetical protein